MQKKLDPKIVKKVALFVGIEMIIAIALVALDLILKAYCFNIFDGGGKSEHMGGFLIFTAVKNTGASFGIFGSSTVALTIVSFVCSLCIFGFTVYTGQTRTPLLRAALCFVFAGAVGNLVDRLLLGYVRDFVQLSIFPWVFNFADMYLTFGVVCLLIYVIFFYTRDKARADKRNALSGKQNMPTAKGLTMQDEDSDVETAEEESRVVETLPLNASNKIEKVVPLKVGGKKDSKESSFGQPLQNDRGLAEAENVPLDTSLNAQQKPKKPSTPRKKAVVKIEESSSDKKDIK